LDNGELLWVKNHGIPLKSNIRISENKIFLIDQDNKIFCISKKDGTKIWDLVSVTPFIKSQNLLSIALSKQGELIAINSTGDLFKINQETGQTYWLLNTSGSSLKDASDFFKSTDIVLFDDQIIFSTGKSTFSHDLKMGTMNWENEASSASTPIIDGKYIFIVTENGFFVIFNRDTGEILSSTNILKNLKKKHRNTKVTGFVMGSGKIYSVTINGYIIVSSATSGKLESFRKIGDPITSSPIIINNKLFILTNNSKIIGLR